MSPECSRDAPSDRQIEEGMAFQSIGGTDFRMLKVDSVSRHDSKMSTHTESLEIDTPRDEEKSTIGIGMVFTETSITKEKAIMQP